MTFERTLFGVTVKESGKNRAYWASRAWIGDAIGGVRSADILSSLGKIFGKITLCFFPKELATSRSASEHTAAM